LNKPQTIITQKQLQFIFLTLATDIYFYFIGRLLITILSSISLFFPSSYSCQIKMYIISMIAVCIVPNPETCRFPWHAVGILKCQKHNKCNLSDFKCWTKIAL